MTFLDIEINNDKVYAGFWKRLAAYLIDTLVMIPFVIIFFFIANKSVSAATLALVFVFILIQAYYIYMHYRFGATLGKMAVGIKVTLPDGSRIGLKHVLLRISIDFVQALINVVIILITLLQVDAELYLQADFFEKLEYLDKLFPWWSNVNDVLGQIWLLCDLIVLLANNRKRAIHDFIAGTVVIDKKFAKSDE